MSMINTTTRTVILLSITTICILWFTVLNTRIVSDVFTTTASTAGPQTEPVQTEPAQASFDCTTVNEIPQIECEALVAIYNEIGGPVFVDNHDWLQTNTPCDWFGVVCNGKNVSKLYLKAHKIDGELPAAIDDLSNLTRVWLKSGPLFINPNKNAQASFDCATVSEISQSECAALVTIYNETGGPNWTINKNWLQTATPCNWYGVTCNEGVHKLYLERNNLTGALPTAIGDLSNLTRLWLSGNQLTNIPSELGNLSNLTALVLTGNQLSYIPAEIGNLSSLRVLSLTGNQLSSIPAEFGDLTNLRLLYLNRNQLDEVPPELGNLVNLVTLELASNQLSIIPDELNNLSTLHRFDVNENPLDTIPAEIAKVFSIDYTH